MNEVRPWLDANGKPVRRLELHLTYTCPERCVFCSEDHRMQAFRALPVTWGRVVAVLKKHAERGVRAVHFTGGEPTIHPRFVDALQLARSLGMRTSIGTIGTMLAREEFAERAVPFLDEALVSLHGPSAVVHDPLAGREGSFQTVVAAMANLRAVNPDFPLAVNTVVTTHNVDVLPDTVAFAVSQGARLVVVSNTTPEGAAFDRYGELAVPLDRLAAVLPRVPERAGDAVLRFFGVPMCLLGAEHRMLSNDLHWDARVTTEWASDGQVARFDDFYNFAPDRKRTLVDACRACAFAGLCTGVYEEYAARWDVSALRPIAPT